MLKQVYHKLCAHGGDKYWPSLYVSRSGFHCGQPRFAPRSFFGVEDFLDDNNSRPYTYQKEKKSKNLNKHVSFKQRTVAYMEPFTLDVFISKRFVSASITHRVTSKQVAVAGTNSKDIKAALKSRSDIPACLAVGRILSERAREADVYTASYTPRDRDKFEGKIRAVVQSLIDNESPFYLEGEGGLFEYVEKRLKEDGHMVIVIAEGAGQKLLSKSLESANEQDASGNKLLQDVGLWISHRIKDHFARHKMSITLKYIDPTYMIRAIPSNASDNVYCTFLAQSCVHGAMAGYTGYTSGLVNGRQTYIPFNRITEIQNRVVITARIWVRLLSSTSQPSFVGPKEVHEAKKEEEPPTQLLEGESGKDDSTGN